MAITCLTSEEAFNAVKGARDCVSVNCSFQIQLKAFEAIQLQSVFINRWNTHFYIGLLNFQYFRFGLCYSDVLAQLIVMMSKFAVKTLENSAWEQMVVKEFILIWPLLFKTRKF